MSTLHTHTPPHAHTPLTVKSVRWPQRTTAPITVADTEATTTAAAVPPSLVALRQSADDDLAARIRCGDLVPSAEFAHRLGISPQALSKALQADRVFYVQSGARRFYPSFFFDPMQERRQLEQVCKVLGKLPGAAKLNFFTTPKVSLGRQTPLKALQKGRLDDVLAAAQSFVDN